MGELFRQSGEQNTVGSADTKIPTITSPDPKTITQELPISHLRQLFESIEVTYSGSLSKEARDVMGHVRLFGPDSAEPIHHSVAVQYFSPKEIEFRSHIPLQDHKRWEVPLVQNIRKKILYLDASHWIEPKVIDSRLPSVLQGAHIPLVILRLGYIRDSIPVGDLFYPRGWDAHHALEQMKDGIFNMFYPKFRTRQFQRQLPVMQPDGKTPHPFEPPRIKIAHFTPQGTLYQHFHSASAL